MVGRSYFYGCRVDRDYDKAFLECRSSADAGDASGRNMLGLCYENGNRVKMDLEKAFQWYQKSAEAGNSNARTAWEFATSTARK